MQSYPSPHVPQISAPKSQVLYCFRAWESTLRLFLKQKGKTVEIKELTGSSKSKKKPQKNPKQQKKQKGNRGKSCWKKSRQNEVKKDMYQV